MVKLAYLDRQTITKADINTEQTKTISLDFEDIIIQTNKVSLDKLFNLDFINLDIFLITLNHILHENIC